MMKIPEMTNCGPGGRSEEVVVDCPGSVVASERENEPFTIF